MNSLHSLLQHLQGDDKENAVAAEAAAAARSILSANHAAGALQPLRAVVSADFDSETEAELQHQVWGEGVCG